MKITAALKNAYKDIGYSIRRFPLTVLFLVAFTFLNARQIEGTYDNYNRLIFTVLIGAMVSAVAQLLYERFYLDREKMRWAGMGVSVVLAIIYYVLLGLQEEIEMSIYVRSVVALFALFIAFIWVPTIRNEKVAFHQSFLAAFKGSITTFLFGSVLGIGVVLIFQAIYFLLFEMDEDLLWHLLNIIGSLFMPLYFLATVPRLQAEDQESPFTVSLILNRLLSFIVIPLLFVYTLILILYILLNIGGDFWTDNLLEPLLVSYTLIGLIVLLLANNIDNRITRFFQNIFPKVFLPIVIFQTIASLLKIREMGITHGRYYVILFGLFAIVAGVLFSLNRPKYYGWLAVVLLVLAAVSIVPPIDAFTVSKRNQIHLFEEKVAEAGLLENGTLVPNRDVSLEDRIALTKLATYLSDMGYADDVAYLPDDFEVYNDFSETFGFEMTYPEGEFGENMGRFAYSVNEYSVVREIQEDDLFTRQYVTFNKNADSESLSEVSFTVDGNQMVVRAIVDGRLVLEVVDNEGNTLITVEASELFAEIFEGAGDTAQVMIQEDFENATFIEENDQVRMKMYVIGLEDTPDYYSADFYLFIDIK